MPDRVTRIVDAIQPDPDPEPSTSAVMIALLITLGSFALIPLLAIWNGFVLSILWGWFITPTFHTVTLTIVQAIGVSIVVHMFNPPDLDNDTKKKKKGKMDPTLKSTLWMFGWPLLGLVLGFIVHLFV